MLQRTANIIGPLSAAAQAMKERDRRKALGEDVVVLLDNDRHMFLVGPPPSPLHGIERK